MKIIKLTVPSIILCFMLGLTVSCNEKAIEIIYKAKGNILNIACSKNGDYILINFNKRVKSIFIGEIALINNRGKEQWKYVNDNQKLSAREIALSPDGKYAAVNLIEPIVESGGEDVRSQILFFGSDGKLLWRKMAEGDISISNKGEDVLVGSYMHSLQYVKLFNSTGTLIATFEQSETGMSDDGTYLMAGGRVYSHRGDVLKGLKIPGRIEFISKMGDFIVSSKMNNVFVTENRGNLIINEKIDDIIRGQESSHLYIGNIKVSANSHYIAMFDNVNNDNDVVTTPVIKLFNRSGELTFKKDLSKENINKIVSLFISNSGNILLYSLAQNEPSYNITIFGPKGDKILQLNNFDYHNLFASDDFNNIYFTKDNVIYKYIIK